MTYYTRPMGPYETNCYIVETGEGQLIIDPGVGAEEWVLQMAKKPLAILNTHGHFDHVWNDAALKRRLRVPLLVPSEDLFMLGANQMGMTPPDVTPDVAVAPDSLHRFGMTEVRFWHFPGHTPGCSVIEIDKMLFCGDFLFEGSIGRVDFPYSDPKAMYESLQKFLKLFPEERVMLPGHGPATTTTRERANIPRWLAWLQGY